MRTPATRLVVARGWIGAALLASAPAVLRSQVVPPAPVPPSAVVHAVLYYSPTCPHCHKVMTEDLPPLFARYGKQLQIAGVDVTTGSGQALYQAAVRIFALPDERRGVPALVVGTRVLVGDVEIPAEFPGIVQRGLAAGGIDWPEIPEFRQALAQAGVPVTRARDSVAAARAADSAAAAARAGAESTPAAAVPLADTPSVGARDTAAAMRAPRAIAAAPHGHRATAPAAGSRPPTAAQTAGAARRDSETPAATAALTPLTGARGGSAAPSTIWNRFLRDPAGNGAALVVMLAMVAALAWVAARVLGRARSLPPEPAWVVPALALLGLGVAAYLSFVEVSGARAVCGPLGDCNTVQQSAYARLFGVLPVGVGGVAGYAAMLAAWLLGTLGHREAARAGRLVLWSLALAATLFSVYLTFLEPFVIGATCSWCLSSAIISMLLLVTSTAPALPDLAAILPHRAP